MPATRRRADAGADLLLSTDPEASRRRAARQDRAEAWSGLEESQVSVVYKNGKPVGASQIVVSHQHVDEDLSSEDVLKIVKPYVKKALPKGWIGKDTVWHVNPTGKFFIGGPDGDTGLTGRKIIVDTYGGAAPHGGGRVLRQGPDQGRPFGGLRGALHRQRMSWRRGLQKALLHPALLRHRCGAAAVDLCRHTFGTGKVAESKLEKILAKVMDLSPRGIRTHMNLNARSTPHLGLWPFRPCAGQGRRLPWEKTDLVKALKAAAK